MNRPLPIPDLWGLHPCASITVNQRPGHPHCKIFSMPQAGRCSHKAAAVRGNCTCGLVEEGRSRGRYPCTVEDPTISLYCRPRTLAWRAPLHTQLRAVCEPQQTALCGLRNAVEEERFSSDYPKPANPVLEIYRMKHFLFRKQVLNWEYLLSIPSLLVRLPVTVADDILKVSP